MWPTKRRSFLCMLLFLFLPSFFSVWGRLTITPEVQPSPTQNQTASIEATTHPSEPTYNSSASLNALPTPNSTTETRPVGPRRMCTARDIERGRVHHRGNSSVVCSNCASATGSFLDPPCQLPEIGQSTTEWLGCCFQGRNLFILGDSLSSQHYNYLINPKHHPSLTQPIWTSHQFQLLESHSECVRSQACANPRPNRHRSVVIWKMHEYSPSITKLARFFAEMNQTHNLDPGDVVVVNYGAHYAYNKGNGGPPELVKAVTSLFRDVLAPHFPGLMVFRNYAFSHFRTPLGTGDLSEKRMQMRSPEHGMLPPRTPCVMKNETELFDPSFQSKFYNEALEKLFFEDGIGDFDRGRFRYLNITALMGSAFTCCHREFSQDCLHYLLAPFVIWTRMLAVLVSDYLEAGST